MHRYAQKSVSLNRLLFAFLTFLALSPKPALAAGNALDYALCDIRVACYFEDFSDVNWPTIYYLNDNFGARIDLIQLQTRASFVRADKSTSAREMYLHSFNLPPVNDAFIDSVTTALFENRPPDIVIFFELANPLLKDKIRESITKLSNDSSNVFGVASVFEQVSATPIDSASAPFVFNSEELLKQYRERMRHELPQFFESFNIDGYTTDRLVYYSRMSGPGSKPQPAGGFLPNQSPLLLSELAQSSIPSGPAKSIFLDKAKKYTALLNAAKNKEGKERTNLIIEAYRALLDLNEHPSFREVVGNIKGLNSYMNELFSKAERAALEAVGLNWNGQIIVRDTPQGPSVKYRASIVVDGPSEVSLKKVIFHPYWDKNPAVLDSISRTVAPHQSFIREYLIEVDPKYLESGQPESLSFTAEIAYSQIPLKITDKLPLWESPDLKIEFVPDFHFLSPIARLDVDRVVGSMDWKVAITKPFDYAGKAKLSLETPKGMFAGAYRQDLELESGVSRQVVRIPFTVSNLFELGIQQATVSLSMKGKVIAADTSRVRIAESKVPDIVKIGFLPDTTGLLEDILSMSGAGFQSITDRTLATGDLNAFDVLIIGSGAFKNMPSFVKVKDRFENYLREGGSIVVLGQPTNWPLNALPASIAPTFELASNTELTNRIPEARLLSQPYKITEKSLLSAFYKPTEVASAVVTPSEQVYVTPSGSTVLSVSRLGSGQLIYCGLPLLQMVSKLNIDAIHLFANILNY